MQIRVNSELHPFEPSASEDARGSTPGSSGTRTSFNEHINVTRVVSNPRGYVGEWLDGFRPNFTLEFGQ